MSGFIKDVDIACLEYDSKTRGCRQRLGKETRRSLSIWRIKPPLRI